MSDNNIDGHNQEMDFEREDLAPRPILLFLLSLVIINTLLTTTTWTLSNETKSIVQ